ncbi:DUF1338 domain-containing protein [uncultured Lacinutrix sp.]|uniref:DUF1338 domain-containing protein n=1 Tax=uncultured Lacinutrix sp. TaxID=574032 RepID=UPI0026273086|nr:DUF1338 domain-containing protein [uncultured Lacinutrix sp.]
MTTNALFEKLWNEYVERTPSAKKVKHLFESLGDTISNDHVAFRTFDDPRVNIDVLATAFINNGYEYKNDYHFPKKKLYAKHYEHKTNKDAPLVFISQLITSEFSIKTQSIIKNTLNSVNFENINPESLIFSGRLWNLPSYELYTSLLGESEYAAWLYVNGFCANHFTINVNALNSFNSLKEVNTFLKANNFKMNTSGGEIKGNPELYLEQSSILADKIDIEFEEGNKNIPSCYYEFAYRYLKEGTLFKGFIANSADKIFESTDVKL